MITETVQCHLCTTELYWPTLTGPGLCLHDHVCSLNIAIVNWVLHVTPLRNGSISKSCYRHTLPVSMVWLVERMQPNNFTLWKSIHPWESIFLGQQAQSVSIYTNLNWDVIGWHEYLQRQVFKESAQNNTEISMYRNKTYLVRYFNQISFVSVHTYFHIVLG